MLRAYQVKQEEEKKKIGFDDSVDITKCLQQIEIPDLLQMCAPGSELPSNIDTNGMPEFRIHLQMQRIRIQRIFYRIRARSE